MCKLLIRLFNKKVSCKSNDNPRNCCIPDRLSRLLAKQRRKNEWAERLFIEAL